MSMLLFTCLSWGAPVHYAIIDGQKETGVTIMKMIKKMDAGGIYAQSKLPITPQDDVGTMFEKLSLLGRDLLLETLPKILDGLKPTPQEEALVTFHQISPVNKKKLTGKRLPNKLIANSWNASMAGRIYHLSRQADEDLSRDCS